MLAVSHLSDWHVEDFKGFLAHYGWLSKAKS